MAKKIKYMDFLKQITPTHLLIFISIVWALILTIIIAVAIGKVGKSDTIVVDATQYINQELKASQQRNLELDSQYKILFQNLVELNKEKELLKIQVEKRTLTIDLLKQRINEKDTMPSFTPSQHDSLFTNFIRGYN